MSAAPTLIEAAWPQTRLARVARVTALMLAGVCLITLSAKIQVPFWPVPMTMQTLAVLMIGMAYGRWLGAATVLAYLMAGAAGLPVFAGTPERGIGLAYMMGPTGGFLVGFLATAFLVGALAERGWDRTFLGTATAMLIGHITITLVGVAWLAVLIGSTQAIEAGLMPFIASSLLKTALGATAMPLLWNVVARRSAVRRQR